MRRAIIVLLACIPAFASGAAQIPEGRWEGQVRVPGRMLELTVDLAPGNAGAWAGSIVVPGLGVKGAPLSNIVVTSGEVSFEIANLFDSPSYGPARFKVHLAASGDIEGEMTQAGNVAPLSLRRTGSAQVESAPPSTAVGRGLEAQWNGEFELGGYPRHVTITFENHADGAATAKFVVVGKQTTDLPVDLVVEEGNFVRLESQAYRMTYEGRFVEERNEITGTIALGAVELPLVLHRSTGRAS